MGISDSTFIDNCIWSGTLKIGIFFFEFALLLNLKVVSYFRPIDGAVASLFKLLQGHLCDFI